MGKPIEPIKLQPDEKKIVSNLLNQERLRARQLHSRSVDRTEKNAMSFYHKYVSRSLNKVNGTTMYTEDLS